MAEATKQRRSYDSALLRRLVSYLRPYRFAAGVSIALLIAHSALGVIGPFLTKVAVDRCLLPTPQQGSFLSPYLPAGRADALLALTAFYVAVLAVSYFTRAAQIHVMNRTGQQVMFDLRQQVFKHLQTKSVAYFDKNPIGRLVTRVTNDVDALNEMFTSGVAAMAGDLVTLAFIYAAMLYLSPMLTLVLTAFAPAILWLTLIFRKRARAGFRDIRAAVAKINSFLQEHLSGVAVVQLFTDERRSGETFAALNEEHRKANLETVRAYAYFFPAVEWLGVIGIGALLVVGAWLVEEGALTIGVIAAFLQYGSRVFKPVQDLSEKFNILQSAMASSERIFDLLDTPVDEALEPAPAPGPAEDREGPRVEFQNVWFAYKGEDWVLRDVSFTAEPNEMLAIVGHTGAGKTTLINLLLRFYEPQKGRVLVRGKDVREWSRGELRREFGVVLQDPYLFDGTVADNLRLGDPQVTVEQGRQAAERVRFDRFVKRLPGGYDEPVGERGATLSTGQKQLLGFARALARNTRFLILDEATSSVDAETEHDIREALAELVQKHTSIVIAHRLSTIKRADRVVVMHKGEVRETGKHRELLAEKGLYWKLYQLQFQGQENAS